MATGRSLSKMSKKTFDFICTLCENEENKTVEAVRYCKECFGYCCQQCTDLHDKFPTLRNHNLMGQENQTGNQRPTLPEFPTKRCGEHHDKVLDMYCEKHDVVGCCTCISKNHRSCPESQVYSISDMLDKLFNLSVSEQTKQHLKEKMGFVKRLCDSKDVQLAELIKAKNETLRKVTEFQKALEAAIKRATEMSEKELEGMYKKLEEEILQVLTEIKKIEAILRNTSDNIKKAEGNRAQVFVLTKLAEAQMKQADDLMSKLKTLTDDQISFTHSQSLMDYINGQKCLGEVVGPSKKTTDQTVIEYGAHDTGAVVSHTKKRTYQTAMEYEAHGTCAEVSPLKKKTDQTAMEYGARGTGAVVSPTKETTDQTAMAYKASGTGAVVSPTKETTDQTAMEYEASGTGEVVSPAVKKTDQTVMEYGARATGAVVSPLKATTDQTAMEYGARGTGAVVSSTQETTDQTSMEYEARGTGAVVSSTKETTDQTAMEYGARGTGAVVNPTKETTDQTAMEYEASGTGAVVSPAMKKTDQTVMEYGARATGAVVSPLKETTDQTAMEYGARGTGVVVSPTKKGTDLYKVKGSKDINIKLPDDSSNCHSFGCCFTLDNKLLLITDSNNKKLKRFDVKTMTIIDHCDLDGRPIGVCCVGTHEAVVACGNSNMIQFISIDKKMTPTKQIKMSHYCYGIATKDDKLYVTDYGSSLYIYDMQVYHKTMLEINFFLVVDI